jgi:hypothetical protein
MNKFLGAISLIWTLSWCGERGIPKYQPNLQGAWWTEIYWIEWNRGCFAWEIWKILIIWCEWNRIIELPEYLEYQPQRCDTIQWKLWVCFYDWNLDDLWLKYNLSPINISNT